MSVSDEEAHQRTIFYHLIWVLGGDTLKMVWDMLAHFYSTYHGGRADDMAL